MGPGSDNNIINMHHYQHQHLSNVVAVKGYKKPNGKSPSPSWFYDQMKGTVSAYENGKVHPRQPTKRVQKSSSSPQQFHVKTPKPVAVVKQSSSPKPILQQQQAGKPFYAGAKFESHPSHMVLPTPPSHWTAPLQRSQSQPSSPTLKSMQKGVGSTAIDLTSLFGSPNPVAKSFPGERMMQALMRAEEKKKDVKLALESKEVSSDEESVSEGESKDVIKKKETSPVTDQLKTALGLLTLSSIGGMLTSPSAKIVEPLKLSCHASATPKKSYTEMSAQLKFLMNVAA